MNADQSYISFIKELKQNIVQSRYIAARLANKEQLLLYLRTGKMLTEKIGNEKWGNAILKKISISFTHHILLLNKCKEIAERMFYITHAAAEFWSVSRLEYNIKSQRYQKQGSLPNNFSQTLPTSAKATALEVFKDEYLFDFVSLEESEDERVLEASIIANIKQAIMRLGKGIV